MGSSSKRPGKQDGVGVGLRTNEYQKPPICPRVFKEKLPTDLKISVGTKLALERKGTKLYVTKGNLEICALGKARTEQILKCIGFGFKYAGVVKSDKEVLYGEFTQSR